MVYTIQLGVKQGQKDQANLQSGQISGMVQAYPSLGIRCPHRSIVSGQMLPRPSCTTTICLRPILFGERSAVPGSRSIRHDLPSGPQAQIGPTFQRKKSRQHVFFSHVKWGLSIEFIPVHFAHLVSLATNICEKPCFVTKRYKEMYSALALLI